MDHIYPVDVENKSRQTRTQYNRNVWIIRYEVNVAHTQAHMWNSTKSISHLGNIVCRSNHYRKETVANKINFFILRRYTFFSKFCRNFQINLKHLSCYMQNYLSTPSICFLPSHCHCRSFLGKRTLA